MGQVSDGDPVLFEPFPQRDMSVLSLGKGGWLQTAASVATRRRAALVLERETEVPRLAEPIQHMHQLVERNRLHEMCIKPDGA